MRHTQPQHDRWNPWWAVALAAFLLMQSLVMATTTAAGVPPDEWAHLSYIRDVANGGLVPDYAEGRIRETPQGNYLSHPPLYYSLLGKAAAIAGLDPMARLFPLRVASALFMVFGFWLWLRIGRALGLPLAGAVLLTIALCATPMFSYLAGSVNNDTLLYLGFALFAAGLVREHMAHRRDLASGMALAGGALIVMLTKATGAAFLVLFVLVLLMAAPRELRSHLTHRRHVTVVGIVGAACLAWFGWAMIVHGGPLPRPQTLYPHNPPAEPLTLLTFALRYVELMWDRLPMVMSSATFNPFAGKAQHAFYAMVVLPVLVWMLARPGASKRGVDPRVVRGTDALALATLGMAVIHIAYIYNGYRSSGLLAGMQPRYFAFLLPVIWLPAFLLERRHIQQRCFMGIFAALAMVAFWTSVPHTVAGQARAVERARPVPPAAGLHGSLDEIRLEGRTLHLRGWAFDADAGAPAAVEVQVDGATYTVDTGVTRRDVARALGHDSAQNSGFDATIDVADADGRECAIGITATAHDGRILRLRKATC